MESAPARTVVTSLQEWAALIRADGVGTGVRLIGELVEEPREGRRVRVLLPTGDGAAGFAPLPVMVDSIRRRGGAGEHATGQPKRPAGIQPALGCQVTVEGRVDVDRRGALHIKGGALDVEPTSPGPYSAWRRAQAAAAGIEEAADVLRGGVEAVVTHLRAQPEGKQVLWLGRETQAYRDAHRGHAGLITALKIAGAAMSGPYAVEEMCRALAAVDPDRFSLVLISRGGGDPGDLAVFDDARVLQAVRSCPVRTVVAVGHFQDQPLVEAVCDWALATPSDINKALRVGFITGPTQREKHARQAQEARQQRDRQEEQRRELIRARADLAVLQRERDLARQDTELLRRGWIATVRDENARRITERHRVMAGWIAVAAPVLSGLWAWDAPSTWHVTELDPLVLVGAGWAFAIVVRAAPRRLGRRPWIRRGRTIDPATAYRAAKTVPAFNRAAAAHDGRAPRLRRPRP